jgi:hypothetical protein
MIAGLNYYKDFNVEAVSGVAGITLNNFEFSSDYSSFTMSELLLPNPLGPIELGFPGDRFYYLAGTQIGDPIFEPIVSAGQDSDGDGVCDAVDVCDGDDALGDNDGDLICDDDQ